MSFADLKKNSKFSFNTLSKEIEKLQNPSNSDDRIWKITTDKAGNGFAVIRFLPAPQGEDLPWVKVWNHGFKGPLGDWYIENSLTTLGLKDPVYELNRQLYNTGNPDDEAAARNQKRKLSYYSNIYVVSDPANPANEGKVFLFRYGKKIFDKIQAAMKPEPGFESEAFNPFDFWTGAHFKLRAKKVSGYPNYDDSSFANPSVLGNLDDEELEQIWRREYSLTEFLDAKNFKSYEELEARLNVVLNRNGGSTRRAGRNIASEDDEDYSPRTAAPEPEVRQTRSSFAEMTKEPSFAATAAPSRSTSTDEDDDMDYFARLYAED